MGHVVRPIVHHGGKLLRFVPAGAAPTRTWIEVVCKMIPAVVAGGGLLAPQPLNPPPLPERPAFTTPAPTLSPRLPRGWAVWPDMARGSNGGSTPTREEVPEPSSAGLLLGGAAGLVVLRLTMRGLAYSTGGPQPTSCQTNLLGVGPIA